MSSKVDTLFKKAVYFEKLALYSDRKSYLAALAQGAPDTKALVNAINASRLAAVRALNGFWRQNPEGFPVAAKTDYSALAYPATDITKAEGEQLTSAMDQFLASVNSAYRVLTEANDHDTVDFAQNTLYPIQQRLENQINQYKDAVGSILSPGGQGEEEGFGDKLQIPEQTIVGEIPPSIDPESLKAVQSYVKADPDGKWGPQTSGALQQWANNNKMKGQSMQAIVDAVKARAMGNQVANKIQFGPGGQQARNSP